jgi:adenylate cyclase class 2
MPVEIEAKMRVDDFAAVRDALARAAAQRVGEVVEENIFFDTPDQSLRASGNGLRLRRNRDTSTGQDNYVITFKGRVAAGELKVREEIEVTVDVRQNAIDLLDRLGYQEQLSFEKRRETWKLDGCKVELDELPQIGRFVEVEGPDEATVNRVRETLSLTGHALIKESYAAMVAKQREPVSAT